MRCVETGAEVAGVAELAAWLAPLSRLLVLTGAGISTASGIPAYRDQNGVRRGKAPVQGPQFRSSEAVRRRYWARSMIGWPTLSNAAPNAGHRALAELEAAGAISGVLTQNVDGLHRQAGSANVIELHGNIHTVVCLDCGAQVSRHSIQSWLTRTNPDLAGAVGMAMPDGDAQFEPDALARFHIPACAQCGGTLQPDVVFFGDGVPRGRADQAERAVAQADGMLVVGSSLSVLSGYRLCRMAAEAGKPVAAINLGTTRADAMLSLKLQAASEIVLPLLARHSTRRRQAG